ncbi:alpha/beta hydrolase [Wenzhouxiangella sp. XN79A]|uniref:alpha/beta hydrolase n=1 Tax=Wenzhouxiangella sp. XN79A TaxID=2724193 RepID=UPI00144A5E9D|nr:alpha/beta hydrolase [Wenzhouxiangella sp. XN79A]NKI36450.1 alpha/beta hydrolase [Wenzhouxiangella sp. XN79A]
MYIITNRNFRKYRNSDLYTLTDDPNPNGSKELRLFEATPRDAAGGKWDIHIIPDRPEEAEFEGLDTDFIRPWNRRRVGSDLVAARLIPKLRESGRNLVLFIHGYNTTIEDALNRARRMEQVYDVEVLVFSWPSNGGGDSALEELHGVASYLSDKSDARESVGALDRALWRMNALLQDLNAGVFDAARDHARASRPDSRDEERRLLANYLREHACPFNISLIAHSMGNYLYKKLLTSSSERLSCACTFDNVILKAADTNHHDHAEWVQRIRARKRVYILINQDDSALGLSNLKIGEAQKPRLGATIAQQNAHNAAYIDLTGTLDREHSYFDNQDTKRTVPNLEPVMRELLNGRIAHRDLPYEVGTNTYRLD